MWHRSRPQQACPRLSSVFASAIRLLYPVFFAPLQEGAKPVLPAHVLERERNFNTGELAYHPVGTGPFRFHFIGYAAIGSS